MSKGKKILLVFLLLFGVNWYVTYNLRYYAVFYAKNAFNDDIDIVTYHIIKNLKDIPLYFSTDPLFLFQYHIRSGTPVFWRTDYKMSIAPKKNGYILMIKHDTYTYDTKGNIVDMLEHTYDSEGNLIESIPPSKSEGLNSTKKADLATLKQNVLQPLLDIQLKPTVNLQWLFNWQNQENIKYVSEQNE